MNAILPRRPRALLLDDDPEVLRLLGRSLQARGFEVLAAMDGTGGLGLLLDELLSLDVVAVDLDLSGRDAWSLLRLIREAGGERDLGVVVLGSGIARGVVEQLIGLGADAVVDRSEGPATATRTVLEVVAHRRADVPRPAPSLLAPPLAAAPRGRPLRALTARAPSAA